MTDRADLPRLEDLPIPVDVRPDRTWTAQMLEMADHIGPHATLKVVAARGGEHVYVSGNAEASPFREVLTADQAATIARVYAGSRLKVPVARNALARARRAGVLAAVRADQMTVGDAAKILQTSRNHCSHLVNHGDEAADAAPIRALPKRHDPNQLALFSDPTE